MKISALVAKPDPAQTGRKPVVFWDALKAAPAKVTIASPKAMRVELRAFAPQRQHRILDNFFRECGRTAAAHEKPLQARSEMVEQRGKSILVASIAHGQQMLGLLGYFCVVQRQDCNAAFSLRATPAFLRRNFQPSLHHKQFSQRRVSRITFE